MPAAVAAPWQSGPDHPLVGMETAAPGPGHAVSLLETPSETFITSATVVLADWLGECGVETVVMESTGVYWIPLFGVLEERGFQVMLVDPRRIKNVPGRKTDVVDCQWRQRYTSRNRHYEYREYLCRDCQATLDFVMTERQGAPAPAVIQLTTRRLSHLTWQNIDGQPTPCSHQTYVAVFQALLDRALLDHGVRRRTPEPAARDDTPRRCEEPSRLPAVSYEDIPDRHELDEGKRRQWRTMAGSIETARCRHCDASVTEIRLDDAPAAVCVISASHYGPYQAWQNIQGAMTPTDIATAVLRGYTAVERLRQLRAGIPTQYRRTTLKPSWNTALSDLRTAAAADNPR